MISMHLPMIVVASFQQRFHQGSDGYDVLFEGKTQGSSRVATHWVLTIREHPGNGMVKYVVECEAGVWRRSLCVNGLNALEERNFLAWALLMIGTGTWGGWRETTN